MKKLFVCAMALAAFVSCSKDDVAQESVLDSANKSIAITIANGTSATRGDAGHTTAANGTSQIAVADASELVIFFADDNGLILEHKALVGTGANHDKTDNPLYAYGSTTATGTSGAAINGDYIFHNIPAAVTQVAIARYEGFGTDEPDVDVKNGETNLSAVLALATSNINEKRAIDEICLYGVGTVGTTASSDYVEVNGVQYRIYPVSVTVTPKLARLEINNIECLNLGEANDDINEDGTPNISTFGIDELQLLSLGWGGTTTTGEGDAATTSYIYNIPAADFPKTLVGTYNGTTADANDDTEGDNAYKLTSGVWSWNVPVDAAVPSDNNPMVLGLKAKAYDYKLAEDDLKLVVNGLKDGNSTLNAFSAANIYQLNLEFDEGDIAGQEGVCVNVTVTISPWKVKTVTPLFSK